MGKILDFNSKKAESIQDLSKLTSTVHEISEQLYETLKEAIGEDVEFYLSVAYKDGIFSSKSSKYED